MIKWNIQWVKYVYIYVPGSVVMGAAVVRRGVGGSVLTSVAYCPKNLIVYVSTFTNTLKYLESFWTKLNDYFYVIFASSI